MTDFLHVVEMGKFGFAQADNLIRSLRHKVGKKTEQLRRLHPDAKESWQRVKDDLRTLGVNPDNTYLYIQGHHLCDKVVSPMLRKVCDKLVRMRENEITQQSVRGVQRRNELSCYSNSVDDITSVLKRNAGFMRSPEFARIKADLQRFVDGLDQPQT